jgi:general stress protein YciG
MGKKVVVDVTELGRAGGKATAANRTPEERSEAARKAVQARWAKTKGAKKKGKT